MTFSWRSLLNFLSIVVTGFFVVVFLVGDWVGVYGTNGWMKLLWVILLISLQTFLGATWKPPSRWERRIGWGKWMLVLLAGAFLVLTGVVGGALSFAGPSPASLVTIMVVSLLLLAQGLWMVAWALANRRPVMDSGAAHGAQ